MSFLFGGRGREDRELAESNRRFREHIARDINDERTLAGRGELAGHKRRSGWLLLALVGVFILGAAFFRGGAEPVTITRSCTAPALAIESATVDAGANFYLRATGPQDTSYVLAVAGQPVQGQADRSTLYTPTPAGPSFALTDCVSPIFLIPAPVRPGPFDVDLIRYDAAGQVTVASVEMTAVG